MPFGLNLNLFNYFYTKPPPSGLQPGVQGWHPGEKVVQDIMGFSPHTKVSWKLIKNTVPEEHQDFYNSRLEFLAVAVLDAKGRPWSSVWTGKDGSVGFIKSLSATDLEVEVHLIPDDPSAVVLNQKSPSQVIGDMFAGLGVELGGRRRNKFSGFISKVDADSLTLKITVNIDQAITHCPKYVSIHTLVPHPASPELVYQRLFMTPDETLPDDMIELIQSSDMMYLGTAYIPQKKDAALHPPRVSVNHRGGLPGFMRVRNDKKTLVFPDYSGNRMITSLGNIVEMPLASVTVPNFVTGDVLYITGTASSEIGPTAEAIMPRSRVLIAIEATGYVFLKNALNLREDPNVPYELSPYNPPVLYLAEESHYCYQATPNTTARLTSIELHPYSSDAKIVTLTFMPSRKLNFKPGQAVNIDLSPWLGHEKFRGYAPQGQEGLLNDDHVRAWVVTSAPTPGASQEPEPFTVTIQEKSTGIITPTIFRLARHPDTGVDGEELLPASLGLTGVFGSFILPDARGSQARRFLWVAGGIGVTPFLSFIRSLHYTKDQTEVDFLLSTKEPDVLLDLLNQARTGQDGTINKNVVIRLHLFTPEDEVQFLEPRPNLDIVQEVEGRLSAKYVVDLLGKKEDGKKINDAFICAPSGLESVVADGLKQAGVSSDNIRTLKF